MKTKLKESSSVPAKVFNEIEVELDEDSDDVSLGFLDDD